MQFFNISNVYSKANFNKNVETESDTYITIIIEMFTLS